MPNCKKIGKTGFFIQITNLVKKKPLWKIITTYSKSSYLVWPNIFCSFSFIKQKYLILLIIEKKKFLISFLFKIKHKGSQER